MLNLSFSLSGLNHWVKKTSLVDSRWVTYRNPCFNSTAPLELNNFLCFCILKQGVTKKCLLSWLTNGALVYEPKYGRRGGGCGVSANDYSCTLWAQINFGDLAPYLTYVKDACPPDWGNRIEPWPDHFSFSAGLVYSSLYAFRTIHTLLFQD